MKIVGIGVDIVSVDRVKKIKNIKEASKYLMQEELKDLAKHKNQAEFFASRMAAKEAVIKACPHDIYFHDIHVYKNNNKIYAKIKSKNCAKYCVFLSISHEFKHAIAYAIIVLK